MKHFLMSEFDFGFGGVGCTGNGMGDVDTDRGEKILNQFNNAMLNLYSPGYSLTLDDLVSKYPAGIIEGIGLAANSAGMSDSDAAQAMTALARAGHGLLPKTWNGYFNALTSQAMPSEWMSAIESGLNTVNNEVVQPAEDILHAAGQTVIAAGNLSQLAPLFLYGIVGLFAYSLWNERKTLASDMGKGIKQASGAAVSAATYGLLNLTK